jgi:hypothetical protein
MKRPTGLRLLILVGACCAFVAVLRNHAEIVIAHANRESPKSAALPQGSHSLGRCRHLFSLRGEDSAVFNLESSDVGASDRRPRHEERYHEV